LELIIFYSILFFIFIFYFYFYFYFYLVVDLDSRSGIGATVAKLGSVLSDINLGHSISFLNESELLSSFLAASGVDNLDLAMAEKELKKFRTVDYLANYTVFNFDLTSPLGISSAVTGAYAGMGLLVCFISVLCCCTCECGRAAIFAVLKGLGKLLLWLRIILLAITNLFQKVQG
jgi:hypothetical protein